MWFKGLLCSAVSASPCFALLPVEPPLKSRGECSACDVFACAWCHQRNVGHHWHLLWKASTVQVMVLRSRCQKVKPSIEAEFPLKTSL